MELKRITEERLQSMALLPEAEWTAEERALVNVTPAYLEEINAYRELFQELEMVEEPSFSPGFEAAILDQLPTPVSPVTSSAMRRRVPAWVQWTGLGSLVAGTAAATLFFMFPSPSLSTVDVAPAQDSLSHMAGFFEGNALLIASGCIAILGSALLDKYLRKNSPTRLSI